MDFITKYQELDLDEEKDEFGSLLKTKITEQTTVELSRGLKQDFTFSYILGLVSTICIGSFQFGKIKYQLFNTHYSIKVIILQF